MHRWIAGLLVLFLLGCSSAPEDQIYAGGTMGTTWSVKARWPQGVAVPDGVAGSLQADLDTLEAALSTYRDDSEVSRFNDSASSEWFAVSPTLVLLVQAAQEISDASGGAFDITVGPLVDLWGFGPDGQPRRIPDADEITQRLNAAGYQQLEARAEPPALRKQSPGLRIDLSAIAKGYAVDRVGARLNELGATAWMVEVGGEVRTRGERTDGRPWQIAVERPVPGERAIQRVVPVSNVAIATSGDYRNFFELDGQRYSHTIDPRTGRPVTHRLVSASVVAESAMQADAWATALMVLGPDEGLEVAKREGLATDLIVATDDGFEERPSAAFAPYAGD